MGGFGLLQGLCERMSKVNFIVWTLISLENTFGIAHFYHKAGTFLLKTLKIKFQFRIVLTFYFWKKSSFLVLVDFASKSGVLKTASYLQSIIVRRFFFQLF